MPKPPAEFELIKLYKGAVQIKYFPNSHAYKVYDPEYKRNWEQSPSATGLTDKMEKGAGLMMYAMSESMKYLDRNFTNRSLKQLVDDKDFSFQQLFKDARQAHKDKTATAQRVGHASHSYVEQLLKGLKNAQDTGTQYSVPMPPRATDIKADLIQSWQMITDVSDFSTPARVERYAQVVQRDIDVRTRLWQEAQAVQNACEGARAFFTEAARQGAIKVWAVEQMVHSRILFVSGRFDSLLEFVKDFTWKGYTIPAGLYVTDFKTSNPSADYPMGIFPNHLAQVGVYDVALCEERPNLRDKIKGHLILGSSKIDGGFHPYVSLKRERNRDWAIALAPVNEFMHQGDKDLKGLKLYGDN